MAFFTYHQNNSGGSFDHDEERGIGVHVIIEADDAEEADYRAGRVGLYFDGNGDCPCCGDRWIQAYAGSELPEIYGTPAAEYKPYRFWLTGHQTFVHYRDSQIEGLHHS